MEIDFPFSNNYYPITSWHQVHNYYFELKSQLNSNGTILLNDNLDLFEGASIEKKYDAYNFIYEGKISDYLFDYNYDNVLRKCTINNNPWNSSWKYDMVLTYQNFLLIQFRIIFSRNS